MTAQVDIKFDVNDLEARRRLDSVAGSADNIGKAADRGKASLSGMLRVANDLKGAIDLSMDFGSKLTSVFGGFTDLSNRIATVTGRTDELYKTQLKLYDIADKNRTSIKSTAELYSTLGRSMKEAKVTQNEILAATSTIQKAVKIGGSDAAAAAGALTQLGQALGSGVLRGDEFNSVMEQAPTLARAIAKELGVGTGKLREMANNGELLSAKVFKALVNQSHEINEQFKNLAPKMEEGFSSVSESMGIMLHEFDRATGVSNAIATSLLDLSTKLNRNKSVAYDFGKDVIKSIAGLQIEILAVIEKLRVVYHRLVPEEKVKATMNWLKRQLEDLSVFGSKLKLLDFGGVGDEVDKVKRTIKSIFSTEKIELFNFGDFETRIKSIYASVTSFDPFRQRPQEVKQYPKGIDGVVAKSYDALGDAVDRLQRKYTRLGKQAFESIFTYEQQRSIEAVANSIPRITESLVGATKAAWHFRREFLPEENVREIDAWIMTWNDLKAAIFGKEERKEPAWMSRLRVTMPQMMADFDYLRARFEYYSVGIGYVLDALGGAFGTVGEVISAWIDVAVHKLRQIPEAAQFIDRLSFSVWQLTTRFQMTYMQVKQFADNVIYEFFRIYDEVIAHSWWTDLIRDVISTGGSLWSNTQAGIVSFSTNVINYFKTAYTMASWHMLDLEIRLNYFRESLENFSFSGMLKNMQQMWLDAMPYARLYTINLISVLHSGYEKAANLAKIFVAKLEKLPLKTIYLDLKMRFDNSVFKEQLAKLQPFFDGALKIFGLALATTLVGMLAPATAGVVPFAAILATTVQAALISAVVVFSENLYSSLTDSSLASVLGYNMGRVASMFAQSLIANLPHIIGSLFTFVGEFIRGALEQLPGALGDMFKSIFGGVEDAFGKFTGTAGIGAIVLTMLGRWAMASKIAEGSIGKIAGLLGKMSIPALALAAVFADLTGVVDNIFGQSDGGLLGRLLVWGTSAGYLVWKFFGDAGQRAIRGTVRTGLLNTLTPMAQVLGGGVSQLLVNSINSAKKQGLPQIFDNNTLGALQSMMFARVRAFKAIFGILATVALADWAGVLDKALGDVNGFFSKFVLYVGGIGTALFGLGLKISHITAALGTIGRAAQAAALIFRLWTVSPAFLAGVAKVTSLVTGIGPMLQNFMLRIMFWIPVIIAGISTLFTEIATRVAAMSVFSATPGGLVGSMLFGRNGIKWIIGGLLALGAILASNKASADEGSPPHQETANAASAAGDQVSAMTIASGIFLAELKLWLFKVSLYLTGFGLTMMMLPKTIRSAVWSGITKAGGFVLGKVGEIAWKRILSGFSSLGTWVLTLLAPVFAKLEPMLAPLAARLKKLRLAAAAFGTTLLTSMGKWGTSLMALMTGIQTKLAGMTAQQKAMLGGAAAGLAGFAVGGMLSGAMGQDMLTGGLIGMTVLGPLIKSLAVYVVGLIGGVWTAIIAGVVAVGGLLWLWLTGDGKLVDRLKNVFAEITAFFTSSETKATELKKKLALNKLAYDNEIKGLNLNVIYDSSRIRRAGLTSDERSKLDSKESELAQLINKAVNEARSGGIVSPETREEISKLNDELMNLSDTLASSSWRIKDFDVRMGKLYGSFEPEGLDRVTLFFSELKSNIEVGISAIGISMRHMFGARDTMGFVDPARIAAARESRIRELDGSSSWSDSFEILALRFQNLMQTPMRVMQQISPWMFSKNSMQEELNDLSAKSKTSLNPKHYEEKSSAIKQLLDVNKEYKNITASFASLDIEIGKGQETLLTLTEAAHEAAKSLEFDWGTFTWVKTNQKAVDTLRKTADKMAEDLQVKMEKAIRFDKALKRVAKFQGDLKQLDVDLKKFGVDVDLSGRLSEKTGALDRLMKYRDELRFITEMIPKAKDEASRNQLVNRSDELKLQIKLEMSDAEAASFERKQFKLKEKFDQLGVDMFSEKTFSKLSDQASDRIFKMASDVQKKVDRMKLREAPDTGFVESEKMRAEIDKKQERLDGIKKKYTESGGWASQLFSEDARKLSDQIDAQKDKIDNLRTKYEEFKLELSVNPPQANLPKYDYEAEVAAVRVATQAMTAELMAELEKGRGQVSVLLDASQYAGVDLIQLVDNKGLTEAKKILTELLAKKDEADTWERVGNTEEFVKSTKAFADMKEAAEATKVTIGSLLHTFSAQDLSAMPKELAQRLADANDQAEKAKKSFEQFGESKLPELLRKTNDQAKVSAEAYLSTLHATPTKIGEALSRLGVEGKKITSEQLSQLLVMDALIEKLKKDRENASGDDYLRLSEDIRKANETADTLKKTIESVPTGIKEAMDRLGVDAEGLSADQINRLMVMDKLTQKLTAQLDDERNSEQFVKIQEWLKLAHGTAKKITEELSKPYDTANKQKEALDSIGVEAKNVKDEETKKKLLGFASLKSTLLAEMDKVGSGDNFIGLQAQLEAVDKAVQDITASFEGMYDTPQKIQDALQRVGLEGVKLNKDALHQALELDSTIESIKKQMNQKGGSGMLEGLQTSLDDAQRKVAKLKKASEANSVPTAAKIKEVLESFNVDTSNITKAQVEALLRLKTEMEALTAQMDKAKGTDKYLELSKKFKESEKSAEAIKKSIEDAGKAPERMKSALDAMGVSARNISKAVLEQFMGMQDHMDDLREKLRDEKNVSKFIEINQELEKSQRTVENIKMLFASMDMRLDTINSMLGQNITPQQFASLAPEIQAQLYQMGVSVKQAMDVGGSGVPGQQYAPTQDTSQFMRLAIETANSVGTSLEDLLTVMSYETGGTMSPTIMGGKGNKYMGLIQFGPNERAQYGATGSLESQLGANGAVAKYLRDRGFKPGMSILDLYSTINAGRPGLYNRSDNGGKSSVADKVNNEMNQHRAGAKRMIRAGAVQVTDAGHSANAGYSAGIDLQRDMSAQATKILTDIGTAAVKAKDLPNASVSQLVDAIKVGYPQLESMTDTLREMPKSALKVIAQASNEIADAQARTDLSGDGGKQLREMVALQSEKIATTLAAYATPAEKERLVGDTFQGLDVASLTNKQLNEYFAKAFSMASKDRLFEAGFGSREDRRANEETKRQVELSSKSQSELLSNFTSTVSGSEAFSKPLSRLSREQTMTLNNVADNIKKLDGKARIEAESAALERAISMALPQMNVSEQLETIKSVFTDLDTSRLKTSEDVQKFFNAAIKQNASKRGFEAGEVTRGAYDATLEAGKSLVDGTKSLKELISDLTQKRPELQEYSNLLERFSKSEVLQMLGDKGDLLGKVKAKMTNVEMSKIITDILPGLSEFSELLLKLSNEDLVTLMARVDEINAKGKLGADTALLKKSATEFGVGKLDKVEYGLGTMTKASGLGVNLERKSLNLMTAANKHVLDNMLAGLEKAQKDLKGDPKLRRSAQLLVNAKSRAIDKFIEEKSEDIGLTAENSGKSFADSVLSGMENGLSGFLSGKKSFKDTLKDMLSSFADGVVNSLVQGFMDPVKKSIGDWLSNLGSQVFSGGSGGGGGFLNFFANILKKADGGYISGAGTGTSDSIPAMLSNGEFVVNAASTARFKPLLHAINSGNVSAFASGGFVGAKEMTFDSSANSRKSGTTVINLQVTGDISRQTRNEINRMIPNIAAGVNGYNREFQ